MTPENITAWLSLAGSVFEMIGVLLMANVYLNIGDSGAVKIKRFMKGMLSALYRGRQAKSLALSATVTDKENKVITLQGLTFIGVGFLLQAINNLSNIF